MWSGRPGTTWASPGGGGRGRGKEAWPPPWVTRLALELIVLPQGGRRAGIGDDCALQDDLRLSLVMLPKVPYLLTILGGCSWCAWDSAGWWPWGHRARPPGSPGPHAPLTEPCSRISGWAEQQTATNCYKIFVRIPKGLMGGLCFHSTWQF